MATPRKLRSERKPLPAQQQAQNDKPSPLNDAQLQVEVLEKKAALSKAKRDGDSTLMPQLQLLLARLNASLPMRIFQLFSTRFGPVMAAGSAYNMFFSITSLLVAGFSIFGIIAAGNTQLQDQVVNAVAKAVPNLIDTGNGGLATKEQLFSSTGGYSWALVISLATSLITSLGWINGLRQGMRGVYGVGPLTDNGLLVKLKDLGTLVILGVALIATTLIGAAVTGATQIIMNWMHLESGFAEFIIQLIGFLVMLALDMIVAVILFRMASGISMPRKAMLIAALVAGLGSTILRLFSAQLIGGVANKPLLAPFAVILGLFVWFYFLSQVYLLSTATGRVLAADEELREESHLAPHKPSLLRRSTANKLAQV